MQDSPYAPITVPKGASFADMVPLKGKPDIGDIREIVGNRWTTQRICIVEYSRITPPLVLPKKPGSPLTLLEIALCL